MSNHPQHENEGYMDMSKLVLSSPTFDSASAPTSARKVTRRVPWSYRPEANLNAYYALMYALAVYVLLLGTLVFPPLFLIAAIMEFQALGHGMSGILQRRQRFQAFLGLLLAILAIPLIFGGLLLVMSMR